MFRFFNDIKGHYAGLRLRELRYRLKQPAGSERMRRAVEKFNRCEAKKPAARIKKEIRLCSAYWGCHPLHYYRYELYKSGMQLSEEELLNYIPEFFFYNLFLPSFESSGYEILLNDKNVTEQVFCSSGIAQPYTICKLVKGNVYRNGFLQEDFNNIDDILRQNKYSKVFAKPSDGEGGKGIYIFYRSSSGKYLCKNSRLFNFSFLKDIGKERDFIIQAGLQQHADLSAIYPFSVNTFRIATENRDGKVRVLCCTLRMGRDGREVDNGTQGGLVLKVDTETGTVGDFCTTEECGCFICHPDTGFIFKGYRIPQWSSVRDFVLESAAKLPYFTYLGWDIALTRDGPVAVETNLYFGLDHFQVCLGGLKDVFGIDDPKYYWKNRGKEQ